MIQGSIDHIIQGSIDYMIQGIIMIEGNSEALRETSVI